MREPLDGTRQALYRRLRPALVSAVPRSLTTFSLALWPRTGRRSSPSHTRACVSDPRLPSNLAEQVAQMLSSIGEGLRLVGRLAERASDFEDYADCVTWKGELKRWRGETLCVLSRYVRGEIAEADMPTALKEAEAWTGGAAALHEVRRLAAEVLPG